MRRICLDTSAYTHFKAGEKQTQEIITQAKTVGMRSIVLGELRAGFRLGKRHKENEADLRAFLSNPAVECLDVNEEVSHYYADIFSESAP